MSGIHPLITSRNVRINKFYEYIQSHGTQHQKKELMANYAFKTGISMETLYRYLSILLGIKIVVEYGKHILSLEQFDKLFTEDIERLKELKGD